MADTSVLVRALVSQAEDKNTETAGSGTAWLKEIRDDASAAVIAGDMEVTSSAFEGGSAAGARKFSSQQLLEIAQLALDEISDTQPDRVIYFDHSCRQVSA